VNRKQRIAVGIALVLWVPIVAGKLLAILALAPTAGAAIAWGAFVDLVRMGVVAGILLGIPTACAVWLLRSRKQPPETM